MKNANVKQRIKSDSVKQRMKNDSVKQRMKNRGGIKMYIGRKRVKAVYTLTILITLLLLFAAASAPISAQTVSKAGEASPYSVVSNFGADPETGRNFTWITTASVKTGFVEYCRSSVFSGFDSTNVSKVGAQNQTVKTDKDTRTIHKASLLNLQPGTEYIYRVGVPGGYSEQAVFKTAEADPGSFTFLNITDTQGASAKDYSIWKNTLDKALMRFPDARFLVHTGDMVDTGYLADQWDMFTGAVESELLNLPILPAVGNHDALNENKTNDNIKNFTDRFNIPDTGDTGAPAGTVYSVEYGDVHIAVMNTQCGSDNIKKQALWLKRDVSESDRKWKIVALHRGPYGATYDTTDIREAWVPVFDELGIDLVLQGHDHNYMRSFPMKDGHVMNSGKGTIYLVSNSGGVKYYPVTKRTWQAVDMQPKTPMYVAVTVSRAQMKIEAYDSKNILRDSVTLVK